MIAKAFNQDIHVGTPSTTPDAFQFFEHGHEQGAFVQRRNSRCAVVCQVAMDCALRVNVETTCNTQQRNARRNGVRAPKVASVGAFASNGSKVHLGGPS